MSCRQFLHLLSSLSIYGAVHAARPGLEPAASLDHVAGQAIWSKDGADPCKRYKAKSDRKWWNFWAKSDKEERCECKKDRDAGIWQHLVPSQGCKAKRGEFTFLLKEADPKTCLCLYRMEKAKERSSPVKVSALQFCSAIVEQAAFKAPKTPHRSMLYFHGFRPFLRKKLHLTSDLCREVLTGTVEHGGEWYDGAAQLSEHHATKGFGYLDPLVTGSAVQSRHHHLLKHVCADECEAIVQETLENIDRMAYHDVRQRSIPFEQSCADRVVRKVEAEILGCCGRACGYNNRSQSCLAWPFFTRDEKVAWLEECCTEYNVLNGSSRQQMCESVLTPEQARRVSKNSTKAKKGTDTGGAYIGQEPRLLWTEEGISKFEEELKNLERKPRKDDAVDSDFFVNHANISEDGIQQGWFVEENILGRKTGPTSLAEIHASSCTSAMLKGLKQCGKDQKLQVLLTCLREGGWQVSDKPVPDPDEIDETDEDPCDINRTEAIRVATPDECLTWNFTEVGIKRRMFVYENQAPAKCKEPKDCIPALPILCHFHSHTSQCSSLQGKGVSADHFDRKGFADYLYWIDESKVQDRRKQIPRDNATVTAALNPS